MKKAKPLIDEFFLEEDYEALSKGVCAGFASCYKLMKSNTALGNFQTGVPQWSHLVRTYVEFGIANSGIEKMAYEFRPNAARNCWHARFYKNGLAWTSHFVGGASNKRSVARKAIYKSELSNRTLSLFPDDDNQADISQKLGYFQLLHAGYSKIPESITLVIQSRDQRTIVAASPLPIISSSIAMVEEVEEIMNIQLLDIYEKDENEGK